MSFDVVRYSEAGRRASAAEDLSFVCVLVVVLAAKQLRVVMLAQLVASPAVDDLSVVVVGLGFAEIAAVAFVGPE